MNTENSLAGTKPRCECHECTQARWKMSAEYSQAAQGYASGGALGGQTQDTQEAEKAYRAQQAFAKVKFYAQNS
jgi:hypothetical protein